MLFGSELFEEYIGQLAMASMASLDIFTEGEQFDAKKLQEKMRVNHFTCFLNTQLYWNNKFYLQRVLKVLALVALQLSFYYRLFKRRERKSLQNY